MSLRSRKVQNDADGFYIVVDNTKYYLQIVDRIDGLVGKEDKNGSYVEIGGNKYYIYIGDKKDSKFANKEDKEKIEVLVFDGLKFRKRAIKPELEEFQKLVGGRIESPYFGTRIDKAGILMTINEESTYTSPTTLLFKDKNGKILGKLYGTIVFHRVDKEGKSTGLSEIDIKFIKKQIHLTLDRDAKTGELLYCILAGN